MTKRARKKIKNLNMEEANKELDHLLQGGHGQMTRTYQLRKHIDALRYRTSPQPQVVKGLSLKAAIRFLHKRGDTTLAEFIEFAKVRGLTKEFASDLFREAALRA